MSEFFVKTLAVYVCTSIRVTKEFIAEGTDRFGIANKGSVIRVFSGFFTKI